MEADTKNINHRGKERESAEEQLNHFEDILSGSHANHQTPEHTANPADTETRIWEWLQVFGNFISKNLKTITLATSVVIGLTTIVLSAVLSAREIRTTQQNFKLEMAAQNRSTSALLFNDYLNELRSGNGGQNISFPSTPDAQKFLGAQTQFILNGVNHDDLRAEILTFLGVTNLGELLKPTRQGDGEIRAPLSVANLSFDGGVIRGRFPTGVFSWTSLRKSTLENVDFNSATFQYTDLSNSIISAGDFTDARFVCASLANTTLVRKLPSFHNTTFKNSDLRGLSISDDVLDYLVPKSASRDHRDTNYKHRELAKQLKGANFKSVLVDPAIVKYLSPAQREEVITNKSTNPELHIEELKDTRYCDKPQNPPTGLQTTKNLAGLFTLF